MPLAFQPPVQSSYENLFDMLNSPRTVWARIAFRQKIALYFQTSTKNYSTETRLLNSSSRVSISLRSTLERIPPGMCEITRRIDDDDNDDSPTELITSTIVSLLQRETREKIESGTGRFQQAPPSPVSWYRAYTYVSTSLGGLLNILGGNPTPSHMAVRII